MRKYWYICLLMPLLVGCAQPFDTNRGWALIENCSSESKIIAVLNNSTDLGKVSIGSCRGIENLDFLLPYKQIRALTIYENEDLKDISAIARLNNLEILDLWDCEKIESFPSFDKSVRLRRVSIDDCGMLDFKNISFPPSLKELVINAEPNIISDFRFVSGCTKLELLECYSCEPPLQIKSLAGLERLKDLRTLELYNCPYLEDITALKAMTKINVLYIADSKIVSLEPVCGLSRISELYLYNSSKLKSLKGIEKLKRLEILSLSECPVLDDISPLSTLDNLWRLHMDFCNSVKDLTPLDNLPLLIFEHFREPPVDRNIAQHFMKTHESIRFDVQEIFYTHPDDRDAVF